MKKSTIKLIAMLLTVVLMLPNFAGAGALNEDDGLLTWEEVEEIGRLEAPATKAYEEIMDAWTDEQGNIVYPDTFGGCYLDDNYMLVIKIVNGDELLEEQVHCIVTNCDCLVFEEIDISYLQLKELQKSVFEANRSNGIISASISQKDSVVDLHMVKDKDNGPNLKNAVKNNSPHVCVTYIDKPVPCLEGKRSLENVYISRAAIVANVSPFPGLTMEATDGIEIGTGTIGWYGTYNFNGTPKDCILTAGHVVLGYNNLGEDVTYRGTPIVPSSYLSNSNYVFTSYGSTKNTSSSYAGEYLSSGDIGFMTHQNVSQTNKLIINDRGSTVTINTWESSRQALTGKTVYKGLGVSGGTSSLVAATDAVFSTFFYDANGNYKTIDVFGMVKLDDDATTFGQDGDSGAPVYLINGAGKPSLCGIFSGEGSLVNHEYYMTPTSLIYAAGFTPYFG